MSGAIPSVDVVFNPSHASHASQIPPEKPENGTDGTDGTQKKQHLLLTGLFFFASQPNSTQIPGGEIREEQHHGKEV
jgi:hypothetical protein